MRTSDHASTAGAPHRVFQTQGPGIGGRIRTTPEDFFVEEIPLYEPCGEGEHLYLFVEKKERTTPGVVDALARHYGVRLRDVGYAGLKDRHAVTRQWFSVLLAGRAVTPPPAPDQPGLTVLCADRHINKLRRGHLRGNRFKIRVRGVDAMAPVSALRTLRTLERDGLANRFGEQRFGIYNTNHSVGRSLVLGDPRSALDSLLGPIEAAVAESGSERTESPARALYRQGRYDDAAAAWPADAAVERRALRAMSRGASPEEILESIDVRTRQFWLSAWQSSVFNRVLDRRVAEGRLGSLEVGDVAMVLEPGGRAGPLFDVDEADTCDPRTNERIAGFELSPSGPLWGPRMRRAKGAIDDAELAVLRGDGVNPATLDCFASTWHRLMSGGRRALRTPVLDATVEGGADDQGLYVDCMFTLGPGSYASVVLGEVMKGDPSKGAADDED